MYIADQGNNRIRKVIVSTTTPTAVPTAIPTIGLNIITTIAGTGTSSYSGDNGAATSAALKYPVGVALDASGRILQLLSAVLLQCN